MFDRKELEYVGEVKMPSLPNQPRIGTPDVRMTRRKRRRKPKVDEYALTSLMSSGLVVGDVAKAYITGGAALAKRYWNEALHPRGWHGRFGHGNGPDARNHRDDVSPFPEAKAPRARKATGARAAKTTAAPKLSKPPVATPAAKKVAAKKTTAPAKRAAPVKTAAKKTTVAPAPKVGVSSSSAAGHYDHKTQNIRDRKAIPRINRGGTHIMYDDNKKPLVRSPYDDPGAAYYARNAGPKRITNERLKDIFEDPSKMTAEEKRMISSAGGAKSLDGNDTISVETSRGTRHLERYAVFGQLRSKIAPGSGDRSATRQDAEAREKQAAKRRASGKVSSTQFGKVSERITHDWSANGKTVPCVFCKKQLPHEAMSIETATPKALGGSYSKRGQTWPAHADCNTRAGKYAQDDPAAYLEEMMKKFIQLPLATRKRLPFVYDEYPQLGAYPGTAAERKKYMKEGPK